MISEIPNYAKEVINESKFYESINIITNQLSKKNTFLFCRISNNSKTSIFSEKLFLNSKQNNNLKDINKFFYLQILKKYFFVTTVLLIKKK